MANMTHAEAEAKAKKAVCACWFWDLAGEAENMTVADLKKIIADPFYVHKQMKDTGWRDECPQYLAKKARRTIK